MAKTNLRKGSHFAKALVIHHKQCSLFRPSKQLELAQHFIWGGDEWLEHISSYLCGSPELQHEKVAELKTQLPSNYSSACFESDAGYFMKFLL